MNVCTKRHGKSSNICPDILVWIEAGNRLSSTAVSITKLLVWLEMFLDLQKRICPVTTTQQMKSNCRKNSVYTPDENGQAQLCTEFYCFKL